MCVGFRSVDVLLSPNVQLYVCPASHAFNEDPDESNDTSAPSAGPKGAYVKYAFGAVSRIFTIMMSETALPSASVTVRLTVYAPCCA